MVPFNMFHRALGMRGTVIGQPDRNSQTALASGDTSTHTQSSCSSSHSLSARSSIIEATDSQIHSLPGSLDSVICASNMQEKECATLKQIITDLKTSDKAKDALLRSTREELKNARDALAETFAEYSSLRDEMKTIRQTTARDHQAVVYGKDLELFTLRKIIEQRAGHSKEHGTKRVTIHQQQKLNAEPKAAQPNEPTDGREDRTNRHPNDNDKLAAGDRALEVRLLRVKKRDVPEGSDDKDAMITQLQEMLALANKAADNVRDQQAELQRAWGTAKKNREAWEQECQLHEQTKEQLQELNVRWEDQEHRNSRRSSVIRLPTIDEDADRNELEAMFDTAQEDNLRLHADVEALEKRLRESNVRMFNAQQDMETLREQVRLERAINRDLEAKNPNTIHRLYYHRLETRLEESRDALAINAKQINLLQRTIAGKDEYIKDLRMEVEAANDFHIHDQDEIEVLKRTVAELQAEKEHSMMDRDFAASQHLRQRTSVRSSGATLINALGLQLIRSSDEPLHEAPAPPHTSVAEVEVAPFEAVDTMDAPAKSAPSLPKLDTTSPCITKRDTEIDRSNSIQLTPTRHIRQDRSFDPSNRWSLMSSDVPPPELRQRRHSRGKSLGLKGLIRKIVGKGEKEKMGTEEDRMQSQIAFTNSISER